MNNENNGPLSGVKVADLTTVLLGPFATQILGDHGADVIKIESPEGDLTRDIGPSRSDKMSTVYLNANRNKRDLCINLKSKDGLAAMMQVLSTVDVFVHNMRPSAVERLGLAYEEVKKINPGIIYCGAFGFDQSGPYADKPAYDDMIQGVSGISATQSEVVGKPSYVPTVLADKATGLTLVYAITMALFHRERTGEGQEVTVPMYETMVQFHMVEHLYGLNFEPPIGKAGYPRAMSPNKRPYMASDGKMIGALPYTNKQWRAFFSLADRADLADDPRFDSVAARLANITELYGILSDIIATKPARTWLALLEKENIPHVPINSPEDLITDPHLVATGFWQEVDHPTEGKLRYTGIPTGFSKSPGRIRQHAPALGEHSVEVLREAGLDEKTIADLLQENVIIQGPKKQ